MEENIDFYKQIFKRDPELQENIFFVQRVIETYRDMEKTLKGLPKDENFSHFFNSLMDMCEKQVEYQEGIIGHYILTMILEDLNIK
jgi:hypothetical protein